MQTAAHSPQLSCTVPTACPPTGPLGHFLPGSGRAGTHHCRELVELRPQVRAPEVDVGGFVPHLVTAGAEWPVRGWAERRGERGGRPEE